jgi:hypothetical protein
MLRLLFIFVFVTAALLAGPQQPSQEAEASEAEASESKASESEASESEASAAEESPAEPSPPAAPTVTIAPSGIVVITGATSAPTPEDEEEKTAEATEAEAAEAEATEEEKAEQADEDEAAKTEPEEEQAAQPETPGPESRKTAKYTYDPTGQPRPTGITVSGHSDADGSQSTRTLRNISGRSIPYLTEESKILSRTPGQQVVERRAHRYDTDGNAVSQQLVREEERRLADGSIRTTTTVYESDMSGRMQPIERIVKTERKVGNVTRSVTTAERPDINQRFSTYKQEESVRTQSGETAAKVETVRKVDDGAGRLIESEREESVMSRSGSTSTTESKVWKRSVTNQDRIELLSRTVGKLVERPDGSQAETVEVYAGSVGGGASNINAPSRQFDLLQTISRETKKGPGGETVETTTSRSRSVANPSGFGAKEVTRSVSRPTADGERVEIQSFEEGVNGRLRQIGSLVEEIQKQ